MVEVKERIKEALRYRRMRQIELCEKTGIPRGTMSQYCSGLYTPSHKKIGVIANALGVNPAWLMGYEDVPMLGKTVKIEGLTADEMSIIALFRQIPEQKQKALVTLLEASLGQNDTQP
jgi:transcriptional regulator with XRE-family HTH domain